MKEWDAFKALIEPKIAKLIGKHVYNTLPRNECNRRTAEPFGTTKHKREVRTERDTQFNVAAATLGTIRHRLATINKFLQSAKKKRMCRWALLGTSGHHSASFRLKRKMLTKRHRDKNGAAAFFGTFRHHLRTDRKLLQSDAEKRMQPQHL